MQIHPLCTASQNGLFNGCLNVLDQPETEMSQITSNGWQFKKQWRSKMDKNQQSPRKRLSHTTFKIANDPKPSKTIQNPQHPPGCNLVIQSYTCVGPFLFPSSVCCSRHATEAVSGSLRNSRGRSRDMRHAPIDGAWREKRALFALVSWEVDGMPHWARWWDSGFNTSG